MISEGIELIRLNSFNIRDEFGDNLLETFMTFFETIYYHLYNLKNTPPWVFLTFFSIVQMVQNNANHQMFPTHFFLMFQYLRIRRSYLIRFIQL